MRFDVCPFKTVEEARSWGRDEIDRCAGMARARYITIAPGQEATYQAKYADAVAYVRAGFPEEDIDQYPWIKKEAEATGASYKDTAVNIKRLGDPWNGEIGPEIEGCRIGGKRTLNDLDSIKAVLEHVHQVRSRLENL